MSVTPQQIVEKYYEGAATVGNDGVLAVKERAKIAAKAETLARASAFGSPNERSQARWLIWETALALGIVPASINDLYLARGKGSIAKQFTVPAMNLRVMAFDSARAAFRAAKKRSVGPLIFEIARSEMTYTDQRPAEYTASILAAAIAEGWKGPVFVQGDHFQVSSKKYASSPESEIKAIQDLIGEAIQAGFYNIDIDTSTMVDLTKQTVPEQQAVNSKLCADFTAFIRQKQPAGIQVSVGGEIGEVGGHNSNEEELRAFLGLYADELKKMDPKAVGLSKISIQTGTSHGGVVLPNGKMAQVAVDFDTLKKLSIISRTTYGLGGAVQHGASTLPEDAFRKFPEYETCEVHLATNFQSMAFDHLPPACATRFTCGSALSARMNARKKIPRSSSYTRPEKRPSVPLRNNAGICPRRTAKPWTRPGKSNSAFCSINYGWTTRRIFWKNSSAQCRSTNRFPVSARWTWMIPTQPKIWRTDPRNRLSSIK